MISLSQIQLLEEKVESAVAKIMQLNQEKEALTQRCLQLEEENKTLQANFLSFEQDQERIEQGIIKALDRLNVVENSVLQAVAYPAKTQEQMTDEVQSSPADLNQIKNNISVNKDDYSIVIEQHGIPSSETENNCQQHQNIETDFGLVPMFSEEILSSDIEKIQEQSEEIFRQPDVYPGSAHDVNQFLDNQVELNADSSQEENYRLEDSGQLDIF